jgi:hypothetical protein
MTWMDGFAELTSDAIHRAAQHEPQLDTPEKIEEWAEWYAGDVIIQSWRQVWGSTTGPFGGIGGQALTGMRVTTVLVSPLLICYLEGDYVCTLNVLTTAGAHCFRDRVLPNIPMPIFKNRNS